jgi:hypothetical protein
MNAMVFIYAFVFIQDKEFCRGKSTGKGVRPCPLSPIKTICQCCSARDRPNIPKYFPIECAIRIAIYFAFIKAKPPNAKNPAVI